MPDQLQNIPILTMLGLFGYFALVLIMYQLLRRVLDLFPPAGRNHPDPEGQSDFILSLQRNRQTQERMSQ